MYTYICVCIFQYTRIRICRYNMLSYVHVRICMPAGVTHYMNCVSVFVCVYIHFSAVFFNWLSLSLPLALSLSLSLLRCLLHSLLFSLLLSFSIHTT